MTAGYKRAEVDVGVADTPENLHQNAATGSLLFKMVVFNHDPANAATIKASINTVSATHGSHNLCPDDYSIEPLEWYEITGEVADPSDYIVVESSDTDVTFTLSGRLDA